MPSWVAALLDVPEEWISHLGGWAIAGSAARYVGTVERRIKSMQSRVAAELRGGFGCRDSIDEDGLLFAYGKFLVEKGCEKEKVKEQLERLNWFSATTCHIEEEKYEDVHFDDGFGEMAEGVDPVDGPDEEDLAVDENGIKIELARPAIRESMKKSLPKELLGQFAVSIGQRSGRRCLHLLGSCHRVPGLHYEDFEIFAERPSEDRYHAHCGQCWRNDVQVESDGESDGSSSTDSEL